jgi:hypothetical protein
VRNADAARLLADAQRGDALPAIARALGFRTNPLPLPAEARGALNGLAIGTLRVVGGRGTLRAMLATTASADDVRETIRALARRLTAASPLPHWLLCVQGARDDIGVAVWSVEHGTPRIAALVVDPRHVKESDAETLCALAAARDGGHPDALVHTRWLEILGRDALSRRFYRRLESGVSTLASTARGRATAEVRSELALLVTSRLLFLTFLESKGWLDADRAFLRRHFDRCMTDGGGYHDRVLRSLFFGTLNTPYGRRADVARAFGRVPFLNGGLFSPTPLERRHRGVTFDDGALGSIVGDLLARFRFTARETTTTISEAAVDPEMLGRAFESLMGAATRRATGAFYTPHDLVAHITDEGLRSALAGEGRTDASMVDALLGGARPAGSEAARLRARLTALKLLDPACGSGAFLVQALERIATLLARCGDARATDAIRRDVLATSIFGVDLNPTAVWLCELRLWLSVVIETEREDPLGVLPLPNLDHNVRVGDALAAPPSPQGWGGDPWSCGPAAHLMIASPKLARLRQRYVHATGARKLTAGATLGRAERAAALAAIERALSAHRAERTHLLTAARGRDLFGGRRGSLPAERARLAALRERCRALGARRRAIRGGAALPFGFAWHFAELAERGGCDLVIGNPPWVRPHALAPRERDALRVAYESSRQASWTAGAALARAGRGFGGQADVAAPFVERSLALLRPGGTVSLLVPAKLWRSLAGGGIRRLLAREARVERVEDWSGAPALFDAATYPSLIIATRRLTRAATATSSTTAITTAITLHDGRSARRFAACTRTLACDEDAASPWLLVPPHVRVAIDRLRDAGPPLGRSGRARLLLGVKCGRNDAFIVRLVEADGPLACVEGIDPTGGVRRGTIERALLRRVIRGEGLERATGDDSGEEHIVWPYGADDRALDTLPPNAARWLAPWRARLGARSDARLTSEAWWSLFRTAAARSDAPRVVWADVARALRPRVLPSGDAAVPLNSCYVLRCRDAIDARTFAALLASPVAGGWFAALAEPARGGYRRHLAWTVALLPIPADWERARTSLGTSIGVPDVERIAAAYGVRVDDVVALGAWDRAETIDTETVDACAP